jgi:hypothetical protein
MKINKSRVFKRAHQLRKTEKISLKSALIRSWKIEKENVKNKPKKKTYSQYLKELKEKDLKYFYGDDVKKVTNKYFEFKRVKDDDNIIIITNNIKTIKDSFVLVVGEKKAVFLKDWQIREVRNYYKDLNAYAVKLNRKYFKIYTFKNEIDENLYFEKDNNFDDLLEIAKLQDKENLRIAEN